MDKNKCPKMAGPKNFWKSIYYIFFCFYEIFTFVISFFIMLLYTMAKITLGLVRGYILVFFIIVLVSISMPAYMIYKYGFNGYLEKKRERRNKRFAHIKKLFNAA